MINQPHHFVDASGQGWALTAIDAGGVHYTLESSNSFSFLMIAQRAQLQLDESNTQTPFALELDNNCHIAVDTPTMELLDEFLQQVATYARAPGVMA